MQRIPGLTEAPKGKLATTRITNEIVRAVNDLAPMTHSGVTPDNPVYTGPFLAKIVAEGPEGEDDFEDNRYWVKACHTANPEEDDETEKAVIEEIAEDEPGYFHVVATNLSENIESSHAIPVNTIVQVFIEPDGFSPEKVRHVFGVVSGSPLRLLRLIGNATGSEKYTAKILKGTLAANPASNLNLPEGMTDDIEVLAYNLSASPAAAQVWSQSIGRYVVGWQIGMFGTTPVYGFHGVLPIGQYQYQIYQMVAQNVAGWDFVRAHP